MQTTETILSRILDDYVNDFELDYIIKQCIRNGCNSISEMVAYTIRRFSGFVKQEVLDKKEARYDRWAIEYELFIKYYGKNEIPY